MFWPLAAIIVPLTGLLAKIEVIDGHKLPREGAYVLAPNHNSEFDPIIVAVATWRMGRAPRFLAKESLFRVPVLGWALRTTGMVPVARSASASSSRATLEASTEIVAKTGAVRLALAGGIPVIPVAQWGTQQILPRYGKLKLWPLRRRVRVVVGDPVDLTAYAARDGQAAALIPATDVVMGEISRLLATLRDEPAPADRWDPSAHGQKETGRLES